MYQLVQRVLQGDAKAQFDTQAAAHGSQTAANFKAIMATMTVHVFPRYALQDQKRYMRRYLKKPLSMKVCSFTTRLTQLNNYQTPIIPLERTVASDKKDIKYIEHTCHNTPGDSTTGKHVIKVPIYDSGHPEE